MDQRLTLWLRLRQARAAAGLTGRQVADELGWTLAEFLLAEAAADRAGQERVSALLDRFGLTADLTGLALDRRDDPLSSEVRVLAEYEKVAATILGFEPLFVPGLLQTRAYAEIALGLYTSADERAAMVDARLARQAVLDGDDGPEVHFLIDESALHRWSGATGAGADVIREQHEHLRRVSRNPRVHLRVVPYRAGLHEGMKGPFVVLDFADPEQDGLVYLEDDKGDVLRTGTESVRPFTERFADLSGVAVPVEDFLG